MRRALWIVVVFGLAMPGTVLGNDLVNRYDTGPSIPYGQFLLPGSVPYGMEAAAGPALSFQRRRNDRPFIDRPLTDIIGLRGGIFYAFIDGEVRSDKAGIQGDPVDLGPNLGLESPEGAGFEMDYVVPWPEIFFQYEFKDGPTFRLEPSYLYNRYEGSEVVLPGQEFKFEGWEIPAGSTFDSEMDFIAGKLNLRATPHNIPLGPIEMRLSLYGGAIYQRWLIRLKMTNNPGSVGDLKGQIKDEMSAVVGHIGAHVEFRYDPVWFYFWGSGLQFDRNELSTNYYEGGIGFKIMILPSVIFNLEGYGFRTRLDRDDQFRIDYSMYGPSVFLIVKL